MLGDTAVANGTYVLHHKARSGQVDEKGVFTHVFERARSGWVCLNSQRTVLREDSNGKGKKQSNAEMPFHIPLFSKSDKEKDKRRQEGSQIRSAVVFLERLLKLVVRQRDDGVAVDARSWFWRRPSRSRWPLR